MKIVLTTHQFLPYSSAGTEILTFETAKALTRRGYDVEVWTGYPADKTLAEKEPFTFYEYEGLKVHCYNHSFYHTAPNRNVMEFEFDNIAFKKHFEDYLKRSKPDIVHFFHLLRFSASAIDACLTSGVPGILTPTDFWIICPTCQLRLSDNSLCMGPDPDSLNCCRHIAFQSSGVFGRAVERLPGALFRMMATQGQSSWWPDKKFSPMFGSLAERKDFILKKVNKLDRVLVPTRFMEKIMVQNGLDPGVIEFIPYGINMKPFEKKIAKTGSERLRVGFMGTLSEHKGAHVLIKAVKALKDMPLIVKIYGKLDHDPGYTKKIKRMAGDDGRIEFCGHFPNDKIGEVFSGIDVLVVPSIWYENTPLVIYSAFASGTPVIATNLGGMSEVVRHEENGLLFEKGDAKGLSVLIKKLVEDRSLIGRLSKNVRPPKSISEYVDDLEGVYKDVLKKRKTA